jgi:hypothetical protein
LSFPERFGGNRMTKSIVVQTQIEGSDEAGTTLGEQIAAALGEKPDAVILFAPPRYDYSVLVRSLNAACQPKVLVGGSSVGGFTQAGYLQPEAACAVALRSDELRFRAGIGRRLGADPARAANEMVGSFEGITDYTYLHRSAIVLVDALVGRADEFLDAVIVATGGAYQLFGGGAADGARMSQSRLFFGTEVVSDAAVGLEILSNKPLGVGLCQGWRPTSAKMRITEAQGNRIISMNGIAAADVFRNHADSTGQAFDPANPIPFFLDNIVGIESGDGFRFRVPIAVNPDGSVTCAADVPQDVTMHIMATTTELATQAAGAGVRRARAQIGNEKPQLAIFFDCLASQARMQLGFGYDPRILNEPLGTANYVGFSTCGQVVRAEGEFNGFQNCTAVVCVIPA